MPSRPEPGAASPDRKDGEASGNAGRLGTKRHKTRLWFIASGGIVILLVVALWAPIQLRCTTFVLLRAVAPSEEALWQVLAKAGNPASLLRALWDTRRIPHRQFVLDYINQVASSRPELFQQMESLVIAATADPDIEARQLAFATLERLKHPQLRNLALRQLSDRDPAVRLLGLQSLRSIASPDDVPLAVQFLADPEPRVVVAAAIVLQRATGENFGIKSTDALPQFTCIDTNPPPSPNLSAIRNGVQRWQEWWSQHKGEYPSPPALPPPQSPGTTLPRPEFALQDAEGKTVRLSQFLGKSVLLVLWSPDAPASLDDVSALKALQERKSERLAILGICLPAAPGCADEHEHVQGRGHEHAHHHHTQCSMMHQTPDQFRALAQETTRRLNINFPMLVDPKGTIGSRFNANDLPVYVLIDPQGRVRHRSVGFRTAQALNGMVLQATPSLD